MGFCNHVIEITLPNGTVEDLRCTNQTSPDRDDCTIEDYETHRAVFWWSTDQEAD